MVDTPTTILPQPDSLNGLATGAGARAETAAARRAETGIKTVAVVGLGYVGLPTGIALADAGLDVIGIDVSDRRLADIREGSADLLAEDQDRLAKVLAAERLTLTSAPDVMGEADAVLICVPTPVDTEHSPDVRFLLTACETVVEQARRGQLIVLTSTSYVGTTTNLLAMPLADRGLEPGIDVHVAFSPERIDPGNASWRQESVPRVG
jgi:UDP-N-acetyl-D-glucosamine dehydrogenase